MSVTPIPVGPFLGGLNTYSDETSIADNEMVICENFELDLDGSLRNRPPIQDPSINFPLGATGNYTPLGYFFGPGLVPFFLASDGLSSTYYFNGTSWVLITATFSATAMAQFDNKAWLVAPVGSASPGGYWTFAGGLVTDANMPKGDIIVAHKFRLWIGVGKDALVNGTRLYFSELLGVPTFWPLAAQFIDVGAGDGQSIVQIKVYFNNLLIFRTDSLYSFVYTSNPAAGVVSIVVPGVGLANKDSVESYESYLYFMYDDKAYEFTNNRANQINVKVPLRSQNRSGIYMAFAVSIFNKRVIFSYYDTLYVFNLRTRTWTTWKSAVFGALGKFIEMPAASAEVPVAVLHRSVSIAPGGGRVTKTLFMQDGPTQAIKEAFTCTLQTKNFNYDAPSVYKKLQWWGADAIFRGLVVATANPISYYQQVTWGQLLSTTWHTLLSYTWGQPFQPGLSVSTSRNTAGSGPTRNFLKFKKGLRFRQIYFKLVFTTDGSTDTAPVHLFSLTTYVAQKEHVSKPIS